MNKSFSSLCGMIVSKVYSTQLLRRSHWIEQQVILAELTKHLYFDFLSSLVSLVLLSLSITFALRS